MNWNVPQTLPRWSKSLDWVKIPKSHYFCSLKEHANEITLNDFLPQLIDHSLVQESSDNLAWRNRELGTFIPR